MKNLIVLSGAGVSAESGLLTFRDNDGLWENYRVEDVATIDAWHNNPELVLDFYNQRRKALGYAKPNLAHSIIAALQEHFSVHVITQNVDDLHERAGSKHILHLHGELLKSQSTVNPALVYDIDGWKLDMGDLCPLGSQLRPHIVWFGEPVPAMDAAIDLVQSADILLVVGTSLTVYPAASLVDYAPDHCSMYLIDPSASVTVHNRKITFLQKKATTGMQAIWNLLVEA